MTNNNETLTLTPRELADARYTEALAYADARFAGRNDRAMFVNDYCGFGARTDLTLDEFQATYYPTIQLKP